MNYGRKWQLAHPEQWRIYSKKYKAEHKEEITTYAKDYNERHKEERSEYAKKYRNSIRILAFSRLGGAICVYCGCNDIRMLEINHKNGDGYKEHKGKSVSKFYTDIAYSRRTTTDLEVVCKVCNARHYLLLKYGYIANKFKITWEQTL